jgi:hypothetical protein
MPRVLQLRECTRHMSRMGTLWCSARPLTWCSYPAHYIALHYVADFCLVPNVVMWATGKLLSNSECCIADAAGHQHISHTVRGAVHCTGSVSGICCLTALLPCGLVRSGGCIRVMSALAAPRWRAGDAVRAIDTSLTLLLKCCSPACWNDQVTKSFCPCHTLGAN